MQRRAFARRPQGHVDLDLCFDCQAIWFDAFESPQLAPGGVIELFRTIESQAQHAARPIASVPRCVTCRAPLALTHDMERGNRFVYYRCGAGHGRFTAFLQFLREKEFVRSLTPAEVERLRATVTQVRCSSCGGPVDITRDAQCPYCRAPIAILDAGAVQRTLAQLDTAEQARSKVDPLAVMDALLEGQRARVRIDQADAPGRGRTVSAPVDLVHEALSMLLDH
jgi:Zn-finger nucleic acid-binding protein